MVYLEWMNTTKPSPPPVVDDADIVAIWHLGNGLDVPLSGAEMCRMSHHAIMSPSHGWHRLLRPFECPGGIIYQPRAQYSASDIERFTTSALNSLADL